MNIHADVRVIHYGPVWGKRRKNGESFSACGAGSTLSRHVPWVTCQACKVIHSAEGKR